MQSTLLYFLWMIYFFFFSSRRRHTRCALVMEFRRVLFRSEANRSAQPTLENLRTIPWIIVRNGLVGEVVCETQLGFNIIDRSEEHTSELQSLMRISYAVFCLKKQNHLRHNLANVDNTVLCQTTDQYREVKNLIIKYI